MDNTVSIVSFLQGPVGATGPVGQLGFKGDKGEHGEKGEKGDRGETGIQVNDTEHRFCLVFTQLTSLVLVIYLRVHFHR
jgi:hypothetical protein